MRDLNNLNADVRWISACCRLDTVTDMCYHKEKVLGAVVYERKDPNDTGERSV